MWAPFTFIIAVGKQSFRDQITDSSAMMAYYALLSLFPMLLLALAVAGFLLSPSSQEDLLETLVDSLPVGRELLSDNLTQIAGSRGPVGLVAVAGLLWTGGAAFSAVERVLNRTFRAQRDRSLVRAIVRRIAAGIVAAPLLIISLAVVIATQAASGWAGDVWAQVLASGVAALASVVVFTLLFKLGPNTPVAFKYAAKGGAVSGLVFEVGKVAFAIYVARFADFALVYGALGTTIAFIVWLYWSSMAFLVGAEVAAELVLRSSDA